MSGRTTNPTHEGGECAICEMIQDTPARGWAYEDDSWVAGTLAGLEVPGWIVLALRRHAVETAPLTEREAADLGVAIGLLTSAVEEATGAGRVYLQTYGELERHWHMLVSARGADVPSEHRHTAFFGHRERYVDAARSEDVLDRVRLILQTSSGSRTAL